MDSAIDPLILSESIKKKGKEDHGAPGTGADALTTAHELGPSAAAPQAPLQQHHPPRLRRSSPLVPRLRCPSPAHFLPRPLFPLPLPPLLLHPHQYTLLFLRSILGGLRAAFVDLLPVGAAVAAAYAAAYAADADADPAAAAGAAGGVAAAEPAAAAAGGDGGAAGGAPPAVAAALAPLTPLTLPAKPAPTPAVCASGGVNQDQQLEIGSGSAAASASTGASNSSGIGDCGTANQNQNQAQAKCECPSSPVQSRLSSNSEANANVACSHSPSPDSLSLSTPPAQSNSILESAVPSTLSTESREASASSSLVEQQKPTELPAPSSSPTLPNDTTPSNTRFSPAHPARTATPTTNNSTTAQSPTVVGRINRTGSGTSLHSPFLATRTASRDNLTSSSSLLYTASTLTASTPSSTSTETHTSTTGTETQQNNQATPPSTPPPPPVTLQCTAPSSSPPLSSPVLTPTPAPPSTSPPPASSPASPSSSPTIPQSSTTTSSSAAKPTTSKTSVKQYVWKQNSWLKATEIYKQLISLLISDITFSRTFAEFVEQCDLDCFSRIMVKILNQAKKVLPFVRALVLSELDAVTKTSEGSALRGNSVSTKVEAAYVKIIGREYIKLVLGELVSSIVNESTLNLEIDKRKLLQNPDVGESQLWDDATIDEAIIRHRQMLETLTMTFLYRITDKDMICQMPRPLRAIAGYIADIAQGRLPSDWVPLVGGFVMLRIFSPAIVSPEVLGVMPPDTVLTPKSRRNLVLLAKVLQCISNGGVVSNKEEYMAPMSDFISKTAPRMKEYLTTVCTDPLVKLNPSARQWADLDTETVREFNFRLSSLISYTDLFDLHRILDSCSRKLIDHFSTIAAPPANTPITPAMLSSSRGWIPSQTRQRKQFLALLEDLGPTPKTTATQLPKDETVERELHLSGNSSDVDVGVLERARFLYQGPHTLKGTAVFYIIFNRVREEFLENINPLLQHVFKVMDTAVNEGKYSIIVDMSWASISLRVKKLLFQQIKAMWHLFSRNYKKNIDKIYIIHPSQFTRSLFFLSKTFTSRKTWSKVQELFNWKELTSIIKLENIMLPDSSKDYITKSYLVIKVNSKGRRQERIIKFTPTSFLNIEPKTKTIRDEKLLSQISEIIAEQNSTTLLMKFVTETPQPPTTPPPITPPTASPATSTTPSSNNEPPKPTGRRFSVTSKLLDRDLDLVQRRYVCSSVQERDAILQDIFVCSMKWFEQHPHQLPQPQEYDVVKVNKAGKHQDRTFKITVDSLMNVAEQQIKTELSFAGIENVILDASSPDTLLLKLRAETSWRKIICKNTKSLLEQLLQGMKQYYVSGEDEFGDE
ncbi:rasGTPase-activating protein [Pelomyxa schiedti]|nr:rasGTPase-activating protein [Pelomyxa schiedti]